MSVDPTPDCWELWDIQRVVLHVLASHGGVLTAGEAAVARRILALEGETGFLWARLVGCKGPTFRVARLDYPRIENMAPVIEALVDGGGFIAAFQTTGRWRD